MNEELSKHVIKTGTLTIGIICKDGIVIAADRRQSYGGQGGGVVYIANTAKKIQEVNERMIVTTAGTASDSRRITDVIRAELRLKELRAKTQASIEEVAHLLSNITYQSIRTPSMIPSIAHFLLAGYDTNGTGLFDISPDGYLQKIETYAATGAGFTQAHPLLDSEYKKGLSIEEGIKLATKCIKASMGREPSVGNGIDIYVVKPNKVEEVVAQETLLEFRDKKIANE